jgi:cell division protein FtsQ
MPRMEAVADAPAPFRWGRFTFWLVGGGVLMLGTLLAWHRTEEFLIQDDRFRIPEAEELAGCSPNLTVEGVHYASPAQIRHIFAEDLGRSLYLVPIRKRREQLLAIDWVEDATVAKIWPSSLKIVIQERTPVAFVHLPPNRRDGMSQFALVDRDGYILRPRVASRFTLPVITGIRENEPLENRKARVRRVLSMLKEVGPLAAQMSEIDVRDPNNIIVSEHINNDVVNLELGEDNFAARIHNFLANFAEIKARRPGTKTLDLRVDGVITAVGIDEHAE